MTVHNIIETDFAFPDEVEELLAKYEDYQLISIFQEMRLTTIVENQFAREAVMPGYRFFWRKNTYLGELII